MGEPTSARSFRSYLKWGLQEECFIWAVHSLSYLYIFNFKRGMNFFANSIRSKTNECFLLAGSVNTITWGIFSTASRDPGIGKPRSRITGLAQLPCNHKVDFIVFERLAKISASLAFRVAVMSWMGSERQMFLLYHICWLALRMLRTWKLPLNFTSETFWAPR